MGYGIIRVSKRKTGSSVAAMARHALREDEVPNAIPGAPKPTPIAGHGTSAEVMQELRETVAEAKAKGGRQGFTRASTPVLDVLVTASPGKMRSMSVAEQDAYFRDSLAFIADKFGGEDNILTAVVHRDESTPHMQVLVMPYDRSTSRFKAGKMIGGPTGLSKLQDEFWERVAQPRGLERGAKGSKAQHIPVRHLYHAMAAGAQPPKFEPVPPPPTMVDRLNGSYVAKKKARDDALERNRKARQMLDAQAKTGRAMHPALIERQADQYRAIQRDRHNIDEAKKAMERERKDAEQTLRHVDLLKKDVEIREARAFRLRESASAEWTKAGGQMLDKSSKLWRPEYVQAVARRLGIELQHGKGIIDQMRRAGLGDTLQDCAGRLDRAMDGAFESIKRQSEQPDDDDSGGGRPRDVPRPK